MRSHGYLHLGMLRILVLLIAGSKDALTLKLRELIVPAVVMKGDALWLNCTYDLENEKLYSIKWHKNNVEFYRYLPEDRPPGQKYELAGIHIDLNKSSKGNIFMPTTDVNSEGRYRCEVSTESPSFRTVMGEGEMRIYVNPSRKPEILGNKNHYVIGELVNVTCESAPSRPQTCLKWLINGREPPDHQVKSFPSKESPTGLFTSMQILRFYAQQEHFVDGKMRLQCEAIISQAHTLRSDEITVSNNTTKASAVTSQDFDSIQKDGPVISGGKSEYQVGDTVDVSCTASKSQPPAELQWYINDKEARPEFLVPLPSIIHKGGAVSTVLGLRFEVKSLHFRRNEMRLRCTATLSEVTKMSSEPLEAEIAEQQRSDLHVDFNEESVSNGCTTWISECKCIRIVFIIFTMWSYL